jgi:RNA polymerase sigma factor (sigma-70 family)
MRDVGLMPSTVVGDAEALYRGEADRLWRSVFGFSGDASVADDAVSEAFAQLLCRGKAVRDQRAWVWRAAFKIAAGELQRRGRFEPLGFERPIDDPEPLWDLVKALGGLSDQQRAVVVLRDYAGHTSRGAAEIIGTSEETVRVQLSRARRVLRKELAS